MSSIENIGTKGKHCPYCLIYHHACSCNTCKKDNYLSHDYSERDFLTLYEGDCCVMHHHCCHPDGTADPCKDYEPEE